MAQFALNVETYGSDEPRIKKLNEYLSEGWKVVMISNPTVSHSGSTHYMTYILEKDDEKKVE